MPSSIIRPALKSVALIAVESGVFLTASPKNTAKNATTAINLLNCKSLCFTHALR